MISGQISQIFQNSYFKEHLQTAASGRFFLFYRSSRPKVLKRLLLKIWENFQENARSTTPFFLYKHNDYKHIEAEIS